MLLMRNIFVIAIFSVLFSVSYGLSAQNLDPTVEVTREYEGKLMETHKPVLEMFVPDSVTHFALGFDYSVFENPYKGSYDFNPYLLSMKPSTADMGENKLFLKAGAGYQLHPELDLVWSPKFKESGLNLDVYALHRSFVGDYWNITPTLGHGGSAYLLDRKPKTSEDRTWFGYDLLSRVGADFRCDAKGVAIDVGAGYYGLAQKEQLWNRSFNALDANLGLSTKPQSAESLAFDMRLRYRFADDRMLKQIGLSEQILNFDMSLEPIKIKNHEFRLDLGLDMVDYRKAFIASVGEVILVPHYIYRAGSVYLDAGLRIAKLLRGVEDSGMFQAREQYVYPDITFSYSLVPDAMKLYVTAKGGNTINTYSSILERNHHLTYSSAPMPLDCTLERVALNVGLDGRIASVFSYNLRGGYVNYGNAFLDAIDYSLKNVPLATFRYVSYNKWIAALDWSFKIEDFVCDASVAYSHPWGDVFKGTEDVAILKPALITGDLSFEYNWRRRIFFGADCNFSTERKGEWGMRAVNGDKLEYALRLPGYADVGLYGEYVSSHLLSYWFRVGNLLNMTVQRNPMYAEKGVNFTVGISLSL